MAGDGFRKVTSGEKFRPSARAWNAMLDVAATRDGGNLGGDAPSFGRDPTLVKIQNNTNTNLNQFAIVGLGVPLIQPSDNAAEFRRQITFHGDTPLSNTHEGKFAILQQPLAINAIGWGLVAGVTPAVLNTLNTTSRSFAEIVNGNTVVLRASTSGSAQVMWVENTNAAVTNAVVRLQAPPTRTFVGGIVGVTNAINCTNGLQVVNFDQVYLDPLNLWSAANHRFEIGSLGGVWRMQMNLYLSYTNQAVNAVLDAFFTVSDATASETTGGIGFVYTPIANGNISIPCFGTWLFSGTGIDDYIQAFVNVTTGGGKTATLIGGHGSGTGLPRCVFCVEQVAAK